MLGESFASIAQGSSSLALDHYTTPPQRSASPPPHRSASPISYAVISEHNEGDDGNEGNEDHQQEDFVPTDRNGPPPGDSDPSSDGDSDSDSSVQPAPQPDKSLAKTLRFLAKKIGNIQKPSKPRPKVQQRVPDIFDGTDPSKMDTFTFQVSMYISCGKDNFPDEEAKVAFALSYLKGVPLDWFQGEVARAFNDNGNFPVWFNNYPKFIAELRRLFGPRDPVGDATNALELLKYKDSTKAARYTIDFNRHAHRTGWNDMALARQYYKGLPDRLKDEIARLGKPADLTSLQDLVATLDQRYWERQSEISRDKRSTSSNTTSQNKSTSSDNRNDNRSNNRNDHRSTNNGSKSNNNNNHQQAKHKDQKKPQSAASTSNPSNKANISDMLGPDGKLKPEERQRRMDNNLCLRCAETGHKVNDCPATSKVKPKGRAAKVSTTPSADAPASSGKA
jgi:hypothetical protein